MAHGFKYVPKQRTASPPGPVTHLSCPWCERYHGPGKCLTFGTYVAPIRAIPFAAGGPEEEDA